MNHDNDSLLDSEVLCDPDIVRETISAGCDINAQDEFLATPLHYTSDPKCVIALLEAGADWTVVNCEGLTAVEYDLRYGEGVVAETIEQWVAAHERAETVNACVGEVEAQQGPGL